MHETTLFGDTVFWLALISRRDQYHASAVRWKRWLDAQDGGILTTETVLWEWLNACSGLPLRAKAAEGYRRCHAGTMVEVVPFQARLIERAFDQYESHGDKTWSLTDCLSFLVMRERELTGALTADHHFEQAGFRALLLEDPPS